MPVYLVGSLIIAVLVLSVVLPFAIPREPRAPETYPVEVEAHQTLACTGYTTVRGDGFRYSVPSSYTLTVTLYAKSYTRETAFLARLVPDTQPDKPLELSLQLQPGEYVIRTFRPPWGPAGELTTKVFPGDVVKVTLSKLEINPGTIYSSLAPIRHKGQLPQGFNCPFTGTAQSKRYNLSIEGEKVWAKIDQPGCAGVVLERMESQPTFLVLAEYKVNEYYYKQYDVPFYLLVDGGSRNQQAGFYRRAEAIGVVGGSQGQRREAPNSNMGYQAAAFWYDGSRGHLYLDDSTSPAISTSPVAVQGGDVILGVARERPAKLAPQIKILNYDSWGLTHYVVIDPETLEYEIRRSNGQLVIKGKVPVLGRGEDVTPYLRNYGTAVYFNPNPGYEHVAYMRASSSQNHGTDRIYIYMPALDGAVMDLILVWEDLFGIGQPDGDGDQWIHVTYFSNGTWRIAGYIATISRFKHEFYINDDLIFVKNYGVVWRKRVSDPYYGYLHYEYDAPFFPQFRYYPIEAAPLSSLVRYVGVFKDRKVVVTGLMGGDRVMIAAAGKARTFEARGDRLEIDLLQVFTARELVEAVKSGGITLAIQPSPQRLFYLIPTGGKVHVKTGMHEMWINVPMPVKVECAPSLEVNAPRGSVHRLVLATNDSKMWRVEFNGEVLGTYAKVLVTVYNGTVRIHTNYTTTVPYTYTAPYGASAIRIDTAPVYYVGLMLGPELTAIPYVKRIEVEGTMFAAAFSHGK